MARQLSEAHKAALLAGRRNAEAQRRIDEARRKREYRQWSLDHAKAWAEWQTNCGRSRCTCEWCGPFRRITSAIPDMSGIVGDE